jgi:ATP-dependent RNA helicase RhlE
MSFAELGLNDRLLKGIDAVGYKKPTPVQIQTIPAALSGRDVTGLAQTGTGKTAAFVLPMLHRFDEDRKERGFVRGLVVTPTRELARQVEETIKTLGRFTEYRSLSVYGGVSMDTQLHRLRRGVDIVVATPGRLLDHLSRGTIDLSRVETLVLDEVDRMLDMGFINDVKKILSYVPKRRQTLLFSATIPEPIQKLTASIQKDAELVRIGVQTNPAETITQYFYRIPQTQKLDLLVHMLESKSMKSVLVFSRTRRGADRISKKLARQGFKTTAIHADRSQSQRENALAEFKRGKYHVLVATDIAARGIDVEGISHVVNYDTPAYAEDYIHRIGRTGRAELTGDAITFVAPTELKYFKGIERLLGKQFPLKPFSGFTPAEVSSVAPAAVAAQPEKKSPRQPKKRASTGSRESGRTKRQGKHADSTTRNRTVQRSRQNDGGKMKPAPAVASERSDDRAPGNGSAPRKRNPLRTKQKTRSRSVETRSAETSKYDWRALMEAGEKVLNMIRGRK